MVEQPLPDPGICHGITCRPALLPQVHQEVDRNGKAPDLQLPARTDGEVPIMKLRFALLRALALAAALPFAGMLFAQVLSLEERLNTRYQLTRIDDQALTPGTLLVVRQDGLAGAPEIGSGGHPAIYRNGVLHPALGYEVGAQSPATKAFAKGSLVYVERIEVSVRLSTVQFFLVALNVPGGPVGARYYRSAVRFEFPKGSLKSPIVPDVEETIDGVLEISTWTAVKAKAWPFPAPPASPPQPSGPGAALSDDDIISLVEAKLSDAVILKKISSSRCAFDTSPHELTRLKKAGVSDEVLQAMLDASARPCTRQNPCATVGMPMRSEAGETAEEYTALLEKSPNSALLYQKRAEVYARERRFGKAIADYTQAINLDPKAPDLYIRRGNLFVLTGDFESAMEDLTRAVDLSSNPSQALVWRARARLRSNDTQEALEDLDKAIQADPDNRLAQFERDALLHGRNSRHYPGPHYEPLPGHDRHAAAPQPKPKPVAEPAEEVYTVEPGINAPVGLSMPQAPYTAEARNARLGGQVKIQITIDAQGNVVDAEEASPRLGLGLDESALETARKWKFKPATRNGVPIPVRVVVAFSFAAS